MEQHDDDDETPRRKGDTMTRREGDTTTTRNDTPRSRKVGDRYNNSKKEELGHNDEGQGPSTHSHIPRPIAHTLYYL